MTVGDNDVAFGDSGGGAAAPPASAAHEAQPELANVLAGPQLESLAEEIGTILQRMVHEFMQWGEQFMNWVHAQQMNGFQVPIEAHADYRGRLTWLIGSIDQFSETCSILAAAGQKRPAALLGDYLNGLRGLQAKLEATLGAMQADNFATDQKIRNIGAQMFDTNVQAANTRLGIRRAGDAATAAINSATQQKQQQAFDAQVGRMMGLFR